MSTRQTIRIIILSAAVLVVVTFLILHWTGVLKGEDVESSSANISTSTLKIIPSDNQEPDSAFTDLKQKFTAETFNSPTYITVTDGCGPHFEGDCLNVRSAPSIESDVVSRLRNGQTLKVSRLFESEDQWWYQIVFDEWLRYPERVEGDWYVAAEYVRPVEQAAVTEPEESKEKRIVVDLSEQKLYAYEGEEVFMETDISTGLFGTITPKGTFTVFYRTPSRYMQGPLPGITDDDYDLPGVPWNLYFTHQGAVIHGAYWHDNFGMNWSHGCVNLPPEKAKELYAWTPEGTTVVVQD